MPARWRDEEKPKFFIVHPDNWKAFELFQHCHTQWRTGPMGQRTGLDYSGLLSICRFVGVKPKKSLFLKIQSLEMGALWASAGKPLSELFNGQESENRDSDHR